MPSGPAQQRRSKEARAAQGTRSVHLNGNLFGPTSSTKPPDRGDGGTLPSAAGILSGQATQPRFAPAFTAAPSTVAIAEGGPGGARKRPPPLLAMGRRVSFQVPALFRSQSFPAELSRRLGRRRPRPGGRTVQEEVRPGAREAPPPPLARLRGLQSALPRRLPQEEQLWARRPCRPPTSAPPPRRRLSLAGRGAPVVLQPGWLPRRARGGGQAARSPPREPGRKGARRGGMRGRGGQSRAALRSGTRSLRTSGSPGSALPAFPVASVAFGLGEGELRCPKAASSAGTATDPRSASRAPSLARKRRWKRPGQRESAGKWRGPRLRFFCLPFAAAAGKEGKLLWNQFHRLPLENFFPFPFPFKIFPVVISSK